MALKAFSQQVRRIRGEDLPRFQPRPEAGVVHRLEPGLLVPEVVLQQLLAHLAAARHGGHRRGIVTACREFPRGGIEDALTRPVAVADQAHGRVGGVCRSMPPL